MSNTRAVTSLTMHADSGLVPPMRPHEYAELLADVQAHGVKMPLDVVGDVILDGRHRWRAAREIGLSSVPVREVDLDGETQRTWLVKAAVLRRHLTDDQRGMMAAYYAKQHPKKKAGPGRPKKTSPPTGGTRLSEPAKRRTEKTPARQEAAATMNVSATKAEKAATVLAADPELAAKVHSGEKKLAQAVREITHKAAHAAVPTLAVPDGLFDVIVIDPPWRYDRQPADSGMRGDVDYATMTIDELKALTLPAAAHCILWLWTTNSFMREAYELAEVWGFTPKTILTWDKVHMGLGSWLRNVTEHCVLAVRGTPKITLTNQTTLIREARREHSRKPERFYSLVREVCPGRIYEHFSREARPGIEGFGVEAGKFTEQRP